MNTDFLVAMPSTLSGVARLSDFWGFYDGYNVSPTEHEADARAIFADWRMTAQDLFMALEQEQRMLDGQKTTPR
jgi:hypothetical protein